MFIIPRRLFVVVIKPKTIRRLYCKTFNNNFEEIDAQLNEQENKEYEELASACFSSTSTPHNCFIIHPFIKWGKFKMRDTNPQFQLNEAEALIKTLEPWTVHGKMQISLENLDKQNLFGKGNLEKLKTLIRGDPKITAVFINKSMLKKVQMENLERHFGVPILDRYKIVMQILRDHAKSKHAKLQVALAEIPYIKNRYLLLNDDRFRVILQEREMKIKTAISKLRQQRTVFRNRRKVLEFPVIAVVGYTNSGKTSLIKALTGEKKLQPKNQLFATLDVTMHAGYLPSKLQVLYIDTVGFISNIPTELIECFVATLEDALHSDLILLVEDLSNEDRIHQQNHVLKTLEDLFKKAEVTGDLVKKILRVGNKADLLVSCPEDAHENSILEVSAKTEANLDVLKEVLEEQLLLLTSRRIITIRTPSGGVEMRWLYKNSTVISTRDEPSNPELLNIKTIITQSKLNQFKHLFCSKTN